MKKWLLAMIFLMSTLLLTQIPAEAKADPLKEVKALVKEAYYPGISQKKINESKTMKQLMSKLDPYSVYMTESEMKQFMNDIEMDYIGIGVTLTKDSLGLKVEEVIKNSPAAKQKVKVGYIITKVNNKSIKNMKFEKAVSLLKGKENTSVKVTFYNKKTKKEMLKTLKRKKLAVENVTTKRLAGGIGYIRLNSFSSTSAAEMQKEMKKLKNINGWIFDLRSNGGGDVEAAEKVMGMFKKVKTAYYIKYAKDPVYYYQTPKKQKTVFNGPVALLIDKNSASASEMTAAALKGQKAATLYGQTTYGKGVEQVLFQLTNKTGYLKLTIGEFFGATTKNGQIKINKTGVKPNVKTAIGQELEISHKAILKKKLSKSIKLKNIVVAPGKSQFTIAANKQLSRAKLTSSKIYLMQIGGVTRKIKTSNSSPNKLQIEATAGMKKGTSYYLKIVPKKGKSYYSYVVVK